MKLHTFLILAVGALRLAGCSSAGPDGATVSGHVALTRESDAETGQTGFSFADRTLIDESPFVGACAIVDGDPAVLTLTIEREAPDSFGLASFSLELPIEAPVAPGSAKVTAVAGGTAFEDASGSCLAGWSSFQPSIGHIDVDLDCAALSGGPSIEETVGLSASLSLDGCD